MAIYEPALTEYEAEYRHPFDLGSPLGPHVIVQGSVGTYPGLDGHDDERSADYDVRLLVGPFWRSVEAVVPAVTIHGFWNSNADEDDQELWEIRDLRWDTVGEFGRKKDELRIRLLFKVRVVGENSHVMRLGYYLIATGSALGRGGVDMPEPVKPQG